jgi:hypothetical protein
MASVLEAGGVPLQNEQKRLGLVTLHPGTFFAAVHRTGGDGRMGAMERRTFLLGGAAALQAYGANETVNMAILGVGSRGTAHVNNT